MKHTLLSSLVLGSVLLLALGCGRDKVSSSTSGVIDPTNKWANHTAGFRTCFTNRSAISDSDFEYIRVGLWREFVKTPISFWEWAKCPSTPEANVIRITVSDERPHYDWKSKNGIFYGNWVLNTTYKKWGTDCSKNDIKRRNCMLRDSLHEMGHAAGLNHEQNRADAVCTDEQDLGNPTHNVAFGGYDPLSIMNYCAVKTPGYVAMLTDGDVLGILKVYNTNHCDGGWNIVIGGQKYYAILTGKGEAVSGTIQVPRVGAFQIAGSCVRTAPGIAAFYLQTNVPNQLNGRYYTINGEVRGYRNMVGQAVGTMTIPHELPVTMGMTATKD